jgi:hypothetical protein
MLSRESKHESCDRSALHDTCGRVLLRLSILPDTQSGSAGQAAGDGSDAAELAKKLSNPVSAMISVPFQSNFDFGLGPNEDGFKYTLNFQPVILVSLSSEWNMISRTIGPRGCGFRLIVTPLFPTG